MPIVPDVKDWTWVVDRPCADCGFDGPALRREDVGTALRANAATWVRLLDGPAEDLRRRPTHERWSTLEYACHVRDVLRLYQARLDLMLAQDDPTYPNWDQDRTAVEERYEDQEPAAVAAELEPA